MRARYFSQLSTNNYQLLRYHSITVLAQVSPPPFPPGAMLGGSPAAVAIERDSPARAGVLTIEVTNICRAMPSLSAMAEIRKWPDAE